MDIWIYVLISAVVVTLLVLFQRGTFKLSMMRGNTLLSSSATSKAIAELSAEEEKLQHERLMKSPRYRILHEALTNEVKRIESMSAEEARKKIPHGESERIVANSTFNIVIRLRTDFSATATDVEVMVYPKRFLGSLVALEKWIYLK